VSARSSRYVSRAGDKLAAAAEAFNVDFRDKTVLDIGSSTGGFTDYALQYGAKSVVAVDIGTDQLHPKLRASDRIELHEKTDIFNFWPKIQPNLIVIDVSFTSLQPILKYVKKRCSNNHNVVVLAMLKPQFEANPAELNNGVVKNSTIRRRIIKDFEQAIRSDYIICSKKDNTLAGLNGNVERFYMLRPTYK